MMENVSILLACFFWIWGWLFIWPIVKIKMKNAIRGYLLFLILIGSVMSFILLMTKSIDPLVSLSTLWYSAFGHFTLRQIISPLIALGLTTAGMIFQAIRLKETNQDPTLSILDCILYVIITILLCGVVELFVVVLWDCLAQLIIRAFPVL